jgi:hypothetical protein
LRLLEEIMARQVLFRPSTSAFISQGRVYNHKNEKKGALRPPRRPLLLLWARKCSESGKKTVATLSLLRACFVRRRGGVSTSIIRLLELRVLASPLP